MRPHVSQSSRQQPMPRKRQRPRKRQKLTAAGAAWPRAAVRRGRPRDCASCASRANSVVTN
eukprot:12643140-Heterocapsa_arctica.AAC.1